MATKKEAPAPTPEITPPETEVIQTVKTADGLRWHYEPAPDGQVRVYVTTPGGRQLNSVFSSERAGRDELREYLRNENEIK